MLLTDDAYKMPNFFSRPNGNVDTLGLRFALQNVVGLG